ncbi:MAG: kelch repeat-containing protein [Polyangiaceae bacterium]
MRRLSRSRSVGPAVRWRARDRAALLGIAFATVSCAAEPTREEPRDPEPIAIAAQPVEPTPPWTETGAMSVARSGLTATTLPDGRVVIVGGQRTGSVDTGAVSFETAETWSAQAGAFKVEAAKMSVKRTSHTAVVLADGRVLVAGGGAATSEVFDPKTKAWSAPAPLLYNHGAGATLTLLADGRALLAGGEPTGGVEIFDPDAGGWIDTGKLLFPRVQHAATRLKDGRVLVTGGVVYAPTTAVTATAEIYSPVTGAWTIAKKMPAPRAAHGAALLPNGHVIVIAGTADGSPAMDSVDEYNPPTNTWAPAASLATGRVLHTVTSLDNGAVLVTGGIDAIGSVLRSTELFDPDAAKWISAGLLHHGRLAHAVTAIEGGALAAGGEDQSTAEAFQLATNGQPCEVGRQCSSGFCVDGVCCNTSCDGQCVTCALPGSEGDCAIAAAGTDPHLDCGSGAPCDDVCASDGTCTDRVGEVCVPAACVDDGVHAIVQATCPAPGAACASVTVDCTPYRCGPGDEDTPPGCIVKCAAIEDCAEGYACDPDGECRLRPDVAAASSDGCSASANGPTDGASTWLALITLGLTAARARRIRRTSR